MSKRDRDLVKSIETLGYAYDRTNSKGHDFYIHEDTGCELKLMAGRDESSARKIFEIARHQIGLPNTAASNKRNPAQIRERNAAEHARAKRDLENASVMRDARRAAIDDVGGVSPERLREAEEEFLRAERKFRYWDRLMRGVAVA